MERSGRTGFRVAARIGDKQPMLARKPELDTRYLGTAEDASGQTRLEITSRVDQNGATRVELTQFAWGAGIGWYAQKTLALDEQQVGEILQVLGRTRRHMPRARPTDNVIVLPFAR